MGITSALQSVCIFSLKYACVCGGGGMCGVCVFYCLIALQSRLLKLNHPLMSGLTRDWKNLLSLAFVCIPACLMWSLFRLTAER